MPESSIRYLVSFLEPGTHIYRLTMEIPHLEAGRHRLTLPVWTPGSYQVQDFSRHLWDLQVKSAQASLPLDHVEKSRWEFVNEHAGSVTVRYAVWAYELTVRSSHLDSTHAYWNGAQLFLLLDERKSVPIRIDLEAPAGWIASTGLDPNPGWPLSFRAANYDVLIDSPVEVGTHQPIHFTVHGKPHTLAIWGHGNEDVVRLTHDLEAIVKTQADLFGGLPYAHYTFLLHLTDKSSGGLEHLNSNTCNVERFMFRPDKNYRRVLKLLSHEFFHLWNVKRIHPEALGPFDYQQEVYTRLLWAMEGITDYYAGLALAWGKLITPKDYLAGLGERIRDFEKLPGRFVQSLTESSFDTWIKLYKPTPDSPNRTISYYLKGDLVGTCLDLEIRRQTAGARSLDDVLQRLWSRYGQDGVGFPESVYQETVEEVVGGSMATFFENFIQGIAPLPLDDYLADVGLTIQRHYKSPDPDADAEAPVTPLAWLGVETHLVDQKLVVRSVCDPGPATALLAPGDHVLALDRYEVRTPEALGTRLARDHRPGQTVVVSLFRRGQMHHMPLVLGTAPYNQIDIEPVAEPSLQQQQRFSEWLHQSWEAAFTKELAP